VESGRGTRRRAGQLVDRPARLAVRGVALALVQGYRRAGGVVNCQSPTVLAGSLSAVANWLELNVRRSLDGTTGGRAAQRAEAEVADALRELGWRMTWRHRWTELLLGHRPA
jgi:hypothetical protein